MEALITRCEESLRLGAVDNAVFLADKLFRLHTNEQTALLYVESLSRYINRMNMLLNGHFPHTRSCQQRSALRLPSFNYFPQEGPVP